METREVVIVGAGSAGPAAATLLRRAGVEPLLFEAGPEPGAAWRDRLPALRAIREARLRALKASA